jgi:hypothetical protein
MRPGSDQYHPDLFRAVYSMMSDRVVVVGGQVTHPGAARSEHKIMMYATGMANGEPGQAQAIVNCDWR